VPFTFPKPQTNLPQKKCAPPGKVFVDCAPAVAFFFCSSYLSLGKVRPLCGVFLMGGPGNLFPLSLSSFADPAFEENTPLPPEFVLKVPDWCIPLPFVLLPLIPFFASPLPCPLPSTHHQPFFSKIIVSRNHNNRPITGKSPPPSPSLFFWPHGPSPVFTPFLTQVCGKRPREQTFLKSSCSPLPPLLTASAFLYILYPPSPFLHVSHVGFFFS